MSLYNHAASGVPGTVCGLLTALKDQGSGKLNLGQILAPAIKLSSKGFILTQEKANLFNPGRSRRLLFNPGRSRLPAPTSPATRNR